MLDKNGYRPNVGIVLVNRRNEVFWGKRIREHSWQFPQGGIKRGETPEQAMYRELEEEVGLKPEHVKIIGRTRNWLRYDVPDRWVRREWRGHYRGQKQIWFLLRMLGQDNLVSLRASSHPEFDAWRWNEYWVPLDSVIEFKREVYQLALTELARFLNHRHAAFRGGRIPLPDGLPGQQGRRGAGAVGDHGEHGELDAAIVAQVDTALAAGLGAAVARRVGAAVSAQVDAVSAQLDAASAQVDAVSAQVDAVAANVNAAAARVGAAVRADAAAQVDAAVAAQVAAAAQAAAVAQVDAAVAAQVAAAAQVDAAVAAQVAAAVATTTATAAALIVTTAVVVAPAEADDAAPRGSAPPAVEPSHRDGRRDAIGARRERDVSNGDG